MDLVYKRGYRRICVLEKMQRGKQERDGQLGRLSDHPANCKPHKPDWDAFVAALTFARLKHRIWNPNCDRCHNHTPLTPSETFHQRCAMPQPEKRGAGDFHTKIWKRISPLLSTPRSLWKNKGSSCKVWRRERDFRVVVHTQGKKVFFLWKNMMRTLENRNRSSVSARPHRLTERRESALKQFDYREVITFPPIALPYSPSIPLCCTHRPNSEHDSSLHCHEYQSAGLKDEILLQ